MKTFFGGQKSTPIPSATPGSPDLPALPAETLPRLARSTPVDVHVYISEANDWQASAKQGPPLWSATEFELGTGSTQATALVYAPSHAVQNNGSVFFHAVFTPSGASPDPADGFHDAALTFAKSQPLNVYLKKPRVGRAERPGRVGYCMRIWTLLGRLQIRVDRPQAGVCCFGGEVNCAHTRNLAPALCLGAFRLSSRPCLNASAAKRWAVPTYPAAAMPEDLSAAPSVSTRFPVS